MNEFLTTGEFANKAKVTLRTLRYYDKINLLKPSSHNEKGHRLYSMSDFMKLQKISTLKFIGLSLRDISRIMDYESGEDDFIESLKLQKQVIEHRIHQLNMVTTGIDKMIDNVSLYNKPHWDELIGIMDIINNHNKWLEQYENATNLRKRINIHDQFSTNKKGWMPWFFQELLKSCSFYNNTDTIEILELGCGDGSLWIKNLNLIPPNFRITLTDFSPGMLEDARENLKNYTDKFNFELVDAENIPYENNKFHIVIANHMLYHLNHIDRCLLDIKRVLKNKGYFFTSTVGINHMKELGEIINGVKCKDLKWEGLYNIQKFNLQNGEQILNSHFKDVIINRYEDSLLIDKVLPLTHYILSIPENIHTNLDKKVYNKLVTYIEGMIDQNKQILINKDTGYFRCGK